jgi:PhnB protein
MTPIAAYLNFDGDCREAMAFYQQCLGGKLEVMTFGATDFGGEFEPPPGMEDRIVHACLTGDGYSMMASDTMPGMPHTVGNNISLYLDCESADTVDRRLTALAEGGRITMPAADTFWGAYFAMATDRFGISWMLSFERAPAPASQRAEQGALA